MTTVIIFSKDRPLQLYSLLESMRKRITDYSDLSVNVIYTFSNERYQAAYRRLIREIGPLVNFVYQRNFYQEVVSLVMSGKEYCMFLVDDIVFKNDVSIRQCEEALSEISDAYCFSLRLGKGITYCYPTRQTHQEPTFTLCSRDMIKWSIFGAHGDWNYPHSVDGHIFRKAEMLNIISGVPAFHNPNQFEGSMSLFPPMKTEMLAFSEPALFNIPANRVQSEVRNRNEGLSQDTLLKWWEAGFKINIDSCQDVKNNSCHFPIDLDGRMIERVCHKCAGIHEQWLEIGGEVCPCQKVSR